MASDADVVWKLWAIHEIQQLAYRYAYSVDMRDVELYRTIWAPIGERAELPDINWSTIERLTSAWHSRRASILDVTNHLIDIESPTRASGVVYCRVQVDLDGQWVDQSVLYEDKYVKHEGTWLFLVRRHLLWYGAVRIPHPFAQEPAYYPKSSIGAGTLPEEHMNRPKSAASS